LYELPASVRDDWENEKYWPIVNPNLGRSVDIDFLRSSLIDSKRKGMADTALFASQHFNVEIGQLLRGDRWAGSEFWDKQTDPTLTLETLIERSEIIVLGLDGGGLDDLYGLAALALPRRPAGLARVVHAVSRVSCSAGKPSRQRCGILPQPEN
jgi:phage terminase large subunit-like protein